MADDIHALLDKRQEIETIARQAAAGAGGGPKLAAAVVDAFVDLMPPGAVQMSAVPVGLGPGRSGGAGRKSGTVVLNWARLMDGVTDIVISASEANTQHLWVVVFVGLAIWCEVHDAAISPLGADEATALLALWKYRTPGEESVADETGFAKTNAIRVELGLPALPKPKYAAALERLAQLGCIKTHRDAIYLRDSIRLSY